MIQSTHTSSRLLSPIHRWIPSLQACIALLSMLFWSPRWVSANETTFELSSFWINAGQEIPLTSWDTQKLTQFKKLVRYEKDPLTGKITKWQGILLSAIIDSLMKNMTLERKAQVDLVVLVSATGEHATIPRSFLNHYPLLLASQWDRSSPEINARGPLFSVVPWTSIPKILKEDLPLESFFVPRINRIELTSYSERFQPYFLKRRTDPSAMRGEKLYVQNCTTCHNDQHPQSSSPLAIKQLNETQVHALAQTGHPGKPGIHLKAKDWLFVERYLNAYQLENPTTVESTAQTTGHAHP